MPAKRRTRKPRPPAGGPPRPVAGHRQPRSAADAAAEPSPGTGGGGPAAAGDRARTGAGSQRGADGGAGRRSPDRAGPPAEPATAPDGLVAMARIGAPHGVRGAVRLQPFTDDPEGLAGYRTFVTAGGRPLTLAGLGAAGRHLVATFEEVADRDGAACLTNALLCVERGRLPPIEAPDEFYETDLVGLSAARPDGTPLGRVVAVFDFGAGPLLEIAPPRGETILVPFTRAVVPAVDLSAGRLVVDPPAGLLEPASQDDPEDAADGGSPDG